MNTNARLANTFAQFNANLVLSRKGNRVKNVAMNFTGCLDGSEYHALQGLAECFQNEFKGRRLSEAVTMIAAMMPKQAFHVDCLGRTFNCFSWSDDSHESKEMLRLGVAALAQTNG